MAELKAKGYYRWRCPERPSGSCGDEYYHATLEIWPLREPYAGDPTEKYQGNEFLELEFIAPAAYYDREGGWYTYERDYSQTGCPKVKEPLRDPEGKRSDRILSQMHRRGEFEVAPTAFYSPTWERIRADHSDRLATALWLLKTVERTIEKYNLSYVPSNVCWASRWVGALTHMGFARVEYRNGDDGGARYYVTIPRVA